MDFTTKNQAIINIFISLMVVIFLSFGTWISCNKNYKTRYITKQNFMVTNVEDIPRIVREVFYLAKTGRPGPVLIDVPKDIQQQMTVPDWELPRDVYSLLGSPNDIHFEQILSLVMESKRSVLYIGGGCQNSGDELIRFVQLTWIPIASTMMGLGIYPCSDEVHSLYMMGLHGTMCANYAVDESDLLLAFGVRFHDRVTGKLETFASRAKIVHIDIDSAELGRKKMPHVSICSDIGLALHGMNSMLEAKGSHMKLDFSAWNEELKAIKDKHPLSYQTFGDAIPPQYVIQVLDEQTHVKAIITTGCGQHQIWALALDVKTKERVDNVKKLMELHSKSMVVNTKEEEEAANKAMTVAKKVMEVVKKTEEADSNGERCDYWKSASKPVEVNWESSDLIYTGPVLFGQVRRSP